MANISFEVRDYKVKPLVEVKNLRKIFPIKGSRNVIVAVNNVSFDINKGETFGLIGESGSGKTTVGRCILNLIPITSGSLKFRMIEYSQMKGKKLLPIRYKMQMVFQDPFYSLNPRKTVWATVDGAIRNDGSLTTSERIEMIADALNMVYLYKNNYEEYPHQLSMGQQQRVGIARAMVSKPDFVVLDEPTSSLDISVRGEVIDLLLKIQNELNITYLFISHDLSTIQYLSNRVAIMYLGIIVEIGNVNQIFHKHRHPYSKALLASVMVPDPNINRTHYKLSGEIPSPINLPKGCYLASRCPEVKEVCRNVSPPMIEVEKGHLVWCHFALDKRKVGRWELKKPD